MLSRLKYTVCRIASVIVHKRVVGPVIPFPFWCQMIRDGRILKRGRGGRGGQWVLHGVGREKTDWIFPAVWIIICPIQASADVEKRMSGEIAFICLFASFFLTAVFENVFLYWPSIQTGPRFCAHINKTKKKKLKSGKSGDSGVEAKWEEKMKKHFFFFEEKDTNWQCPW